MSSVTSRSSVRVRYPETDPMGVVHHTHFLVWFEIGRTDLMREAGYPYSEMEKEGYWMPVVEASCRYVKPARYDDLLTVVTTIDEINRATTRFAYRIEREDGTLLATGTTRHAATDQKGVSKRLPERLVSILTGKEN